MNTIILRKDDIISEIHPQLWYIILDDLNVDMDAEEIELQLSPTDTNRKTNFPQETH